MRPRPHDYRLAEGLWDEWGAYPLETGALVDAECAGLLAGLSSIRGQPLWLGTNRLWLARRFLKLWHKTSWFALAQEGCGQGDVLSLSRTRRTNGKTQVRIHLPAPIREEIEAFPTALEREEGLSVLHWAWLRGLWGGCGSLYFPQSGCYLVLRVTAPAIAEPLRHLLLRTGIPWGTRLSHGSQELILRDQENAVTFLCNMGLSDTSLKLEERAILRSMRDRANRVSNCDTANIRRTVRVAEQQTRLALKARRDGLLSRMPPPLRQLAEARLANPEISLSELGQKLSPPIRKSTVKYRWDRLSRYVALAGREAQGSRVDAIGIQNTGE